MRTTAFLFIVALYILGCASSRVDDPLWISDTYTVYSDRIVQLPYQSVATSSDELISDYKSLTNEHMSPRIDFKFSINGKDNERTSGLDHHIVCLGGNCPTPLIRFGEHYVDNTTIGKDDFLKPGTQFHVKLDMRPVFDQFAANGYYVTFNGTRIYKEDFKAVFIAGGTAPLMWDFDNLETRQDLKLHDADGDGIYEITLTLNAPNEKELNSRWSLSRDLDQFPRYQSNHLLMNALYNLSVEEMVNAVEPDSTFRTGKEWSGVWTRDISYSIILAMASQQPGVSRYSLMRKVKDSHIVQDTGTGGAYPVSTDRIVWVLAAWELYKTTGDSTWIDQIYPIIKNSLDDDLKNIYDKQTGLVRGESSFLDWREQTYPDWMQPADIFESECLGTNAIHYQANRVFAQMAKLKNEPAFAEKHERIAENIKRGINQYLWLEDKGYYGQFLYGRNFKIVSPRSEALGEALCILFDIADEEQKKRLIANTPVNRFGIPCIHPQIPGVPPYHNMGVWPFVQTYWTLACAKMGNESAVAAGLSAIYRPTALFLTNKENFVASTGDYAGTQINSDNMLWSLSGQLATIYKVIFGIGFQPDGIEFNPCIPKSFASNHRLKNFKYRNAILDLEVTGFGHRIKSITLDGKGLSRPFISGELTGNHVVKIVLDDNESRQVFQETAYHISPKVPTVSITERNLSWSPVERATQYKVVCNGRQVFAGNGVSLDLSKLPFGEYQIIAIDEKRYESFASEPVLYQDRGDSFIVEAEDSVASAALGFKGFSGSGFVRTTSTVNAQLNFQIYIPADGTYVIDFRYSNGNGPVNTDNKCAIRNLKIDHTRLGTIVLPQRGVNEWSDWGFSNSVKVDMKAGKATICLAYDASNMNMNGDINEAMIDYLRVTRIQ